MDLLFRLLGMLGIIGLGILARRTGILTPPRTALLNAVTFYVALPALIFTATYDQNPADIASLDLLGGVWLTMAATLGLAWLVHQRITVDSRRSVAIVQSFHSNMGYLGLPLVTAGLGSPAAGQAAVILGIGALTHTLVTTTTLVRINGTTTDPRRELGRLAKNPIVLTLAAGAAVATVAWTPPTSAIEGLSVVAQGALPLALLCIGASLKVDVAGGDLPIAGSVIGLKVLAMPAIAFLVFTALGAPPVTIAAAVVMFGTPSAVVTYIYAGELGGDANLASANVLATTIVGVVTLTLLLFLFG